MADLLTRSSYPSSELANWEEGTRIILSNLYEACLQETDTTTNDVPLLDIRYQADTTSDISLSWFKRCKVTPHMALSATQLQQSDNGPPRKRFRQEKRVDLNDLLASFGST
jgi:hypothetical protein